MKTIYESAFDDTDIADNLSDENFADVTGSQFPFASPDGKYKFSVTYSTANPSMFFTDGHNIREYIDTFDKIEKDIIQAIESSPVITDFSRPVFAWEEHEKNDYSKIVHVMNHDIAVTFDLDESAKPEEYIPIIFNHYSDWHINIRFNVTDSYDRFKTIRMLNNTLKQILKSCFGKYPANTMTLTGSDDVTAVYHTDNDVDRMFINNMHIALYGTHMDDILITMLFDNYKSRIRHLVDLIFKENMYSIRFDKNLYRTVVTLKNKNITLKFPIMIGFPEELDTLTFDMTDASITVRKPPMAMITDWIKNINSFMKYHMTGKPKSMDIILETKDISILDKPLLKKAKAGKIDMDTAGLTINAYDANCDNVTAKTSKLTDVIKILT